MNMNAQHTYLHDKNFQSLAYFIEKETNYDLRNKYLNKHKHINSKIENKIIKITQ